jgi:trehalose/maltose hydrolase-like predicted phosphorylase
MTFQAEDYSGRLDLDFSLNLEELGTLYPHLRSIDTYETSQSTGIQQFETIGSKDLIVLISRVVVNCKELKSKNLLIELSKGEKLIIERTVSVFSGRNSNNVLKSAMDHSNSLPINLSPCIDQHLKEWAHFWSEADILLSQAPGPNDALRFNLYHLKSSAALSSQKSVPAKALTGRAYEGHIFWDTEIFILPFFLYTQPDLARELLMYRYNTLDGARKRALKNGFRGACYAWESTETGSDVTPGFLSISDSKKEKGSKISIFTGSQELHITADIAWAVFKYWDATLDQEFLCDYGLEILIETARFWVSRVELSGDHYHLKGVVGPDEYHHGVTDNAFTNWMVRFNLEVAIDLVKWVSKKQSARFQTLSAKLKLNLAELSDWQDVWHRLWVPQPGENGVIEQFEGFFALAPAILSPKEKNRAPILRLFDWEKINQTRITKQADVLMIPFLFPDQLSTAIIRANYDYYDPITDQGSSLSPCIHAAIAARAGKVEDALRYWKESLYFDLHNTMSNSQLGIHAAALGGTWQALVFHLLGVRLSEAGLNYDGNALKLIPKEWGDLEMKLKYRGRTYFFSLKSGMSIQIREEAA